ncbi:MAG: RHS repeat-associated core domain-containing protein [Chlamydiota bacterium]
MRLFFILGLSLRLFASSFDAVVPSSSDEIFSLTSNLLVDGFISVSSGQVSLSETDLHVKGAQDLILKRTYIPPQILGRYEGKDTLDRFFLGGALEQLETKGWVVLPHLWAGYNQNSRYFQVRDPQGFVLEFEIHGNKGILKTSSHGCSNLRSEKASSAADIRNIELWIDGDRVKIIWPDGVHRHYSKRYSGVYFLEEEFLPNGKAIRYECNQGVLKVFSSDPKGEHIYASITKIGDDQYLASDGREARLTYETREITGEFKKKNKKILRRFIFPVMTKANNSAYSNKVGYNDRTLLNFYDARAYPISCSYFQTKGLTSRIQTFSTPSGSTSFSYDSAIAGQKEGSTTVTHPSGAQTIYRFNKILLLKAIENWFEGTLVNKKTFEYDSKQHIKKIETLDGKGNGLLAKHFECDLNGNPNLEKIEGDFGIFAIRRKFDKNRIIFEDRDDGLQYEFTYLGDTWLVTSKTTFEFGKRLRKTIYRYDDANNLFEEEEIGKTRIRYTLYQTAPHLHRIEWEEKTDWEGRLIYQIHYAYDQWGNTAKEQHFDALGKLAYTLERTYNEKGELLCKTNPLGETAIYKYDERGRCFYEEPISNGLILERTFDAKGRLRILNENDYEIRFDYNTSDELIEKTDYLGYKTTYHYHPVHGKPDLIEESPSITKIVYDAFGREKERIDAYDAVTKKTYNSYGSLSKIIYPNGGEETFDYSPNGCLVVHVDPDGLKTTYSNDALGRVMEKTIGDHTTILHYDGYDLYETIDPEGYITEYKYDLVCRKIEEKRDNRIIRFGYDPLGFLAWEERETQRIEFTNDILGQLRKKTIDGVLETAWKYDKAGNVVTIEQGGVTTFEYDAHNRLIKKISPQGHVTWIRYEKAPQLLLKKIIDPLGIETIETYNPQGQLLKKEVAGELVESFAYDNAFRLNSQDHHTFGYTVNGKRGWLKEAEKRTTKWTYTSGDRLLTKQKPDGTTLIYEYDEQWRLAKVGSQEFRYDALDRIIGGTGFSRKLDAFGNILREEWSNGLWIESDYDDSNRPQIRRLPDQSRITYDYEGPFLIKIGRISKEGIEVYSHTYRQHDPRGNPQSEVGLFETRYEYDKSGRQTSLECPYFQETVGYDFSGNLVRKGNTTYTYDALSQMTSESDRFTARYDACYNLKEFNGNLIETDSLNQIQQLSYDLNGNLLRPGFVYDEFDQLVEAGGERSIYDALGRRLQRGITSFLYIGAEEIGAFESGEPKELKIPGPKLPIAIEIETKAYAPIADVQGTIRLLIDWKTKEIAKQNDCDTFGTGLSEEIPYAYAGKRYDPKTGLLYFGKRYYDPSFRRWITPDPLGTIDHSNFYQYVFNNPYLYRDPTGESIGGYLLGIGEVILGGTLIATGGVLQLATCGAYTIGDRNGIDWPWTFCRCSKCSRYFS